MASSCSVTKPATPASLAGLPPVLDIAFCDLVASPAQFDGNLVRLSATWVRGFEASFLEQRDCKGPGMRVWVTFHDDLSKRTHPRILGRLRDLSQRSSVTLVGYFHGTKETYAIPPDQRMVSRGFGHMGAFDLQVDAVIIEHVGETFH
jgi:hypothetical protein